jgi:hypothetical protein
MPDVRVSFPRPCDEKWERMTPAGCDRVCGRCDRLIHDLSHYELDEAVALLRRNPETCVRARIGADGVVALKPGRQDSARRMVIAAAVSAGLLAGGEPAAARDTRPKGAISGNAYACAYRVQVIATDQSGATFEATVNASEHYKIRHIPPGTYSLTFVPDVGQKWTLENVVVGDRKTKAPDARSPDDCIVVGMLRIENPNG